MSKSAPRHPFVPSGFFALRTPLLPFDALLEGDGLTRERLRDVLRSAEVLEALFVASPDLVERLDCWREAPDGAAGRKIERAVLRYLIRMATRPTPFGLFAGCSVGAVGGATRLTVGAPCRRHTRLDMDYVVALADALSRDESLRPHLRFTPNSSLYRVAGRARYLEVRRRDKGWSHHRAALTLPDYLQAVLARAAGGANPAELIAALVGHDPEATHAEAAEYVAALIEQQILVSELLPALTGPEAIHGLIDRLRSLPAAAAFADLLAGVRDDLDALDASGTGASPRQYHAIAARLAELPTELPADADTSRLFQVDLVRPAAGSTLGENVLAEITRGVELLRRLTPPPADDRLTAFRHAFMARFGDTPVTREVPLTEALDDETGIGFGEPGETVEASSLLEGLPLSAPAPRRVTWGPREAYLLGRLTDALARGEEELALTEQDVERLAVPDPLPLPDAFAALARLEAVSDEAVARGDYRLLLASVAGPSGARLLGRFCHADPDLAGAVAGHLRDEEALQPGAVLAEIVHLPEGRLGNILARPTCRPYEIPYLGSSGAPPGRQLPLSDLRVSVEGGRVVLRSEQLGREVVPRLTSAHNFTAGQGIYPFLCALQGQGVAAGLGWDWGPLAGSTFLPRVVYGRLVLARTRWGVTEAEAATLLAGAEEDRFTAVRHWRRERRLPRWVCLVDGDNELTIDLDNRLMVEVMLGQIKGREHAVLTELFPAADRLCATGLGGRYVHELVVPFITRREAERPIGRPPARSGASASSCPRVFHPGSEWLSLKLYAGSLAVDSLVGDVVGPLAAELCAGGSARRWFFVRYADPHGHLRLRFEGEPQRLEADVLGRVRAAMAPFLADGRVWKVQVDTYERELERYGGPSGIGPCEQLFHHDSEATVQLLQLLDDDSRADKRWRLALLGMDRMLDDLGLDLQSKRSLLRRTRDATRKEFGANGTARRMGAKYRVESAALERWLQPPRAPCLDASAPDSPAAWEIFDLRTRRNAAPADLLRRQARLGQLTASIADLAASLLHMHANRLLRSAHRAQEMVLYDFLDRIYEGQSARGG